MSQDTEDKVLELQDKIAALEERLNTLTADYAQGLAAIARGNQLLAHHAHELDITVAAIRWMLVHDKVLNDENIERKRMDIRLAFGAKEEEKPVDESPTGFIFGGSTN